MSNYSFDSYLKNDKSKISSNSKELETNQSYSDIKSN